MVVTEAVIYRFALSAATNQPGALQNAQRVRDCRHTHLQFLGQTAYGFFLIQQRTQNPDAGFVAENLVELGQLVNQFLVFQPLFLFRRKIGLDLWFFDSSGALFLSGGFLVYVSDFVFAHGTLLYLFI